jgi:predicted TIM-barrel fold metal-dependent hydrolase
VAVSEDTRARMRVRAAYLRRAGSELVLDADVHPTDIANLDDAMLRRLESEPGYFHGKPLLAGDLVSVMDRAGVDVALCWHNPSTLAYGEDRGVNAAGLRRSNVAIARLADAHPDRVVPAGWTDPKALGVDNAVELARFCVEQLAMPIVKMNPAQNGYPIDDPMVFRVVEAILELGAVPAFHFGADTPFTPPAGLRRVAEFCGDLPVIAVHMGGGGGHFVEAEPVYQQARRLGLAHPNIFFVLSAIRDTHIESALIAYALAGEPFAGNLGIGSDAPYGIMSWTFGGFRAMLDDLSMPGHRDPRLNDKPAMFGAGMARRLMGGNAAALIADAYERILRVSLA